MSEIHEGYPGKEKTIEFNADYYQFAFQIGYSYNKGFDKPNLIFIGIMFWQIDFAW